MSFCSPIILCLFWFLLPIQHDFVTFRSERIQVQSQGENIEIDLFFNIEPGYHIQDYEKVPDHIIPTSVTFERSDLDLKLEYEFIIPTYDTIILDKNPLKVISDELRIKVVLKPVNINSEAPKSLEGSFKYQACDDRQCFFPREVKFKVSL